MVHSYTAPSSPPTSLNVTVVDSRTVYISWNPPPADQINGVLTGYTVNVSVTDTQNQAEYHSSTTELTLSGLHPFYTYTFIVSAVTVAPGPFSMEYVITTPADGE